MSPLLIAPPPPIPPQREDTDVGGGDIGYYRYYNVPNWMGRMYDPPAPQQEETEAPRETVITSDEISLERMSLTPGRITIDLTDEEAARIKSLDEEASKHK